VPRRPPRDQLSVPLLILCEGPSDEAFFRALVCHRKLPEFGIRNGLDSGPDSGGGIDQFGPLLTAITTWRNVDIITDILIVADNDLSPSGSFDKVRNQIAATGRYEVPISPLVKAAGSPTIQVMMIPGTGKPGNLESLCVEAAIDAHPDIAKCVDQFATCVNADGWPEINLCELKLRSLLAAAHQPNPFIGLGNTWIKDPNLIPLNHSCFDWIVKTLGSY